MLLKNVERRNRSKLSEYRDYLIDNLRAFAIIVVILGHSIILYSSQWSIYTTDIDIPFLDYLKQIINIFQMPLFFSLSGYLFYFTEKKKTFINIFFDKLKRLIIPYLIFSFLWLLPIRLLIKYKGYQSTNFLTIIIKKIILGYDNGHLWYLPTLFFCFIIAYILLSMLKKNSKEFKYLYIWLISLIFYVIQIINNFEGYIGFTLLHFHWFSLGCLISHCKNTNFMFDYLSKFKILITIICIISICIALVKPNILFVNISSFTIIIVCYLITLSIKNRVLQGISSASFGMYLFHSPLVYLTYTFLNNSNPFIVVGINFFVFGTLGYLLTNIIRRSKFKWMVGE